MRYARAAVAVLAWLLAPGRRAVVAGIAVGVGALALFAVGLWTGASMQRGSASSQDAGAAPSSSSFQKAPAGPNGPLITPAPAGGSYKYLRGNWLFGQGSAPGAAVSETPPQEPGTAPEQPREPGGTVALVQPETDPQGRSITRALRKLRFPDAGDPGSGSSYETSEGGRSGGRSAAGASGASAVDRQLATIPDPFRAPVREARGLPASSTPAAGGGPRAPATGSYTREGAAASTTGTPGDAMPAAIHADGGYQLFEGQGPHQGAPAAGAADDSGGGDSVGGNAITPR